MAKATLLSMTGYGEAERELDLGRLRVEIRTVNHRYLNLQLRTPPGFDRHERALEGVLKEHFARGHVQVSVGLDPSSAVSDSLVRVDVDRARGYVKALREIQSELGLEGRIDVEVVSRFRDVFQGPDRDGRTLEELPLEPIMEVLEEAARAAVAMRREEGARLARDLEARLEAMEKEIEAIESRAPERLLAERDRLREAIRELLDERFEVDEERVAREIAHLAERWDIHEELVRFRSHLEMFRQTLRDGDPGGVGKRFGFIGQELLREANTIGSKANDAEIARRVVVLKEEIERLREQLENVE